MNKNSRIILFFALVVLLAGMLTAAGCGDTKQPEQPATSGIETASGDYVGDSACQACHAEVFEAWAETTHGSFIKDATKNPDAIAGDLSGNYPKMLNFTADDIQYVLLSKAGYLDVQELVGKKGTFGVPADDYPVLWGSWNMTENEWIVEVEAIGEGTPWLSTCAGCHVTGLKVPTEKNPEVARSFSGFGISCEQCHGPGAKHIEAPAQNPMVVSLAAENCGQCHVRGASTAKKPDGSTYGYPYNEEQGQYTPDKELADFYTPVSAETDDKAFWPTGHAKNSHHLQYPEWLASAHAKTLDSLKSSDHAADECLECHSAEAYLAKEGAEVKLADAKFGVTCQVCHASHDPDAGLGFLRKPREEICSQCHNAEGPMEVGQAPHHPQKEMNEGNIGLGFAVAPSVMQQAGVTCVDCHMPKTTGPKVSHLMTTVMPKEGKEFGMPDSCSSCHPSASHDYLQGVVDNWQGDVTKKLGEVKAQLEAKKANSETQAYKEALLYSQIVEADKSKGVHNYELTMKLLNAAADRLK